MYEPDVRTPIYVQLDLPSMQALVSGNGAASKLTETTTALHSFLESLPGAQEQYNLLGTRGTLWLSPNLGDLVKQTITSGKMSSPPRVPFGLWWSMLHHEWNGDNGDGGTFLGLIGGYALLTGAANVDVKGAVIVAVPNTFDYPTIQGFVHQITDFQATPILELTALKPLSNQSWYALAYGKNQPLSTWGDSVSGSSTAALSRYPVVNYNYLSSTVAAGSPLLLHQNTSRVSAGTYIIGLKAGPCSSVNGSLEVKIFSSTRVLMNVVVTLDEVVVNHTSGGGTSSTAHVVYTFAANEYSVVVAELSWSSSSLTVAVFIPGTGSTAYTQVFTFTGARSDTETDLQFQVTHSTLTGMDSVNLKSFYLWPDSITVGSAISRLKR